MNNATASSIQNLTLAYFGRPADPASLIGWPASKLTLNQIVQIYVNTAEYRLITFDPNSVLNATGGRTVNDTTLINTFYVRLFGRSAAAVEVAGWTNALATGAVNYDFLGITMLNAGLNLPTTGEAGAMRAVLQAKIDSSSAYTTAIATTPGAAVAYSTATAIQDGITYNLSTTTSTAKTTAQATAAVVTMTAGSNANAGQTFTLTTTLDNFRATLANSVFTGISSAGATNTFQAFDTLAGTGTGNVLNINATDYANAAILAPATVSGIQTINIRATDATAASIINSDVNNFVGATAINSDRSTSAIVLTNLATGATAGMIGNGLTTNGAFTFGYATAAAAATLNISGGTLAGNVVIGTTPSAVTFNSTGAVNTIGTVNLGASASTLTINAATGLTAGNITGAGLRTITVSGAAATARVAGTAANEPTSAVQLGTLPAGVTTVNASGMTAGGVSVILVPTVTSFIGGAGTDTVATAALTTTTAGAINAGTGTDVLRVTAVTEVDTAGEAALYAGFEVLDSLATSTAIDLSLFTGSTFGALRVGGNGVFTNLNATQAANVTVYANSSGNYGLSGATNPGVINTLALTVNDGLIDNNTITLANITAAGVENISISALDNVTISSLIGSTALTNLTFTGGRNIISSTGALAIITNTAINASALTGNFTFNASAGTTNGLGITGSATKVNTITGSNQADLVSGGSANDGFITLSGNDIINSGSGNDTIHGNLGIDTINLQGGNNVVVTRPGDSYLYVTGGTNMASTVTFAGGAGAAGNAALSIVINGITVTTTVASGATDDATEIAIGAALAAAITANPELASYVTAASAGTTTTTLTITSRSSTPVSVGTPTIGTFSTTALTTGITVTLTAAATDSTASTGLLTTDTITGLNLGGSTSGTGVDSINVTGVAATALSVVAGGALAGANLGAAVTALFNTGGALHGTTNTVGVYTFGADSYIIGNIGDSGVGFGTGVIISDATTLENFSDFIYKVNGFTGTLDASDFTFTA